MILNVTLVTVCVCVCVCLRVTIVDLGADQMNPGLVPDGIRCGSDRLCQSQSCVTLASLNVPACPSAGGQVCGGNGVSQSGEGGEGGEGGLVYCVYCSF